MPNVLFSAPDDHWDDFAQPLRDAFEDRGLNVDLARDHPPEAVDYIVYAPNGNLSDFTPYTRARAVLSLWAGVEKLVSNPTLSQPLARMVDDGLTEGMVEWVTGHVLRHHLGMDAHIVNPDRHWDDRAPPLARQRKIAILGLGALGSACARALVALNFQVSGWSAHSKDIGGVDSRTGEAGLESVLREAEIAVLLLPLTPQTEGLMNARRLGWLPTDAVLINPGRGPLIDDDALIEALDTGRLAHATLDVFRQEPLPADHRFWRHPDVTVTPHVASATRPLTAAPVIAENIARAEADRPLLHLVDRGAGY